MPGTWFCGSGSSTTKRLHENSKCSVRKAAGQERIYRKQDIDFVTFSHNVENY